MVRFLHSADWHLGMTRHFFDEETHGTFSEARLQAIRALGELARLERCEFIVVCGDVFHTNQVNRKTVARAMEAIGAIPVPVYILPGNHDPLDPGSIYRTATFRDRKPPNVRVLEDSTPIVVAPNVELVGVPWPSKRPARDLVGSVLGDLRPQSGVVRVVAGHGIVDSLAPDREAPSNISLAAVERALADGRCHYVALGDRHSYTEVGSSGRVRYAGTPEAYDYVERMPGYVVIAELDGTNCSATPHRVGSWQFLIEGFEFSKDADIDAFEQRLTTIDSKERTILKLKLSGTLTLGGRTRLDGIIGNAHDLFAALEVPDRHVDISVTPDDHDFGDLGVSGFARAAVDRLKTLASAPGVDAETARDALALVARLARREE